VVVSGAAEKEKDDDDDAEGPGLVVKREPFYWQDDGNKNVEVAENARCGDGSVRGEAAEGSGRSGGRGPSTTSSSMLSTPSLDFSSSTLSTSFYDADPLDAEVWGPVWLGGSWDEGIDNSVFVAPKPTSKL
jgi:hypothetical protein